MLKRLMRIALQNAEEQTHADGRAASRLGRFREILSDPLNLLIRRVPTAGHVIRGGLVVLHNGNVVPRHGRGSYYGHFSDILVINRGVHEPLEEFCFQRVLGRLGTTTPTMIEVGAYWAHYSMWLKSLYRDARCIMAEPSWSNLQCGRKNFARNGYCGEFLQEGVPAVGRWLPDVMQRSRLAELDILHADVQGAETALLTGASDLLGAGAIKHVFISTHSDALHAECVALLETREYRVEVSSDLNSHTTSSDGFIYANKPSDPALFGGFRPLGREQLRLSQVEELVNYVADCVAYC